MTTLKDRPNTALLVIDVQKGVVEGAHERDTVVANVGSLVERARRERVPVVWVQHSDEQLAKGSDSWRIVSELTPADAEPLVEKSYGDSFEETTQETVLAGLAGEPQRPQDQRDRPHNHHHRDVGELQAVEQRSAVVVEGGQPERRVRPLQVRPDEADEEPGGEHEADQARVGGGPQPA